MVEITEQERLASLVGGESQQDLNTGDMLANGLKMSLGTPTPAEVNAMADEMGLNEGQGDRPFVPTPADGAATSQAILGKNFSSEKLLLDLYDIRDNLIDAFSDCKLNSPLADKLSSQINAIGAWIIRLGGEAQSFDPLNYVSGLETPDIIKNAEEVVKRTIQCYKLGKIEKATISKNGKEINIVFSGQEDDTYYEAEGRVFAEEWTGDEAIDYVYTPSSGKMSVKCYESNLRRWVDKSDGENYRISWELKEQDDPQDSVENSSVKEEVLQNTQNNMDEVESVVEEKEEDIGDPII